MVGISVKMGRIFPPLSILFLLLILPLRISAEGKANVPASEAVNHFVFIRNGNVWVANVHGTDVRQMTFSGKDASPALSPDGKWISYHSGSDERTGFGYLYMVPFTGGEPQRLSLQGMEGGEHPSFSPDGRLIAYQHSGSDVSGGFSVIELTGKTVFRFPKSGSDPTPYWRPQFSPDGKQILCYSPATSEDKIDTIFMIDMKTGLKRRIIEGSNPAFVDSGRSIVFERWLDKWSPEGNAKSDLWYLELKDGARPRKIL